MKSTKLLIFMILFTLIRIPTLFAKDWFVCLGSFKDLANAERFKEDLAALSVPSFVYKTENAEQTLYRVLLQEAFSNADDAQKLCEGLEKPLKKHIAINGELWICEAQIVPQIPQKNESETEMAYVAPQSETLQKNEDNAIPVSEEKPFSLKVRSYKEEHPAVQNSERLRENDIDAYVVKTYDDKDYFSFDVHAGAFATAEESADTEAALAALGINDATLSDYTEIKEKMRRYDEVVQQDEVVFETAENAAMPEFSAAVRKCLADLPVNKNFLIESIAIVDFETFAAAGGRNLNRFRSLATPGDLNLDRFESLTTEDGIRAISKAVYFDDLFGKHVEVSVVKRAEPLPDTNFTAETQFSLPDGDVLSAHITTDGTVRTIDGINTDRTLLVKIDAYDFSDDEFDAFMNNAWADSATVIYPQLRKSLCVLPKNADNRHFVAFTLAHVKESYAVAKHYANWATPKVGHWMSSGYFLQGNEGIKVRFFDMDYEHNAQRINEMYMSEKRNLIISNNNHSATIKGTDAWYVKIDVKQISFAIKSFEVCVDTSLDSSIGESGLNDFASDLLIWEQ